MSTESEYIRALFEAEPDREYYKRRGNMGKAGAQLLVELKREIYLKGDEMIQQDGAYFRVISENGDVYIARDMVERLAKKLGGDSLFDY